MTEHVLAVVFHRNHEFLAQREHLSRGGFFVPLPEPEPEPFAKIVVLFVSPAGQRARVEAKVLQILPGAGLGLGATDPLEASEALNPLFDQAAVLPDPPEREDTVAYWAEIPAARNVADIVEQMAATAAEEEEEELEAHVITDVGLLVIPEGDAAVVVDSGNSEDAPSASVVAAFDPEPPDGGHGDDDEPLNEELEPLDSDEDSATLHDQIRAMSTAEKYKLALHGDRGARLILLKEANKTVHMYIIKNKRITLDEVRYIAGYRQTSPDVLKMIANNREWLQNSRVVVSLVTNPKTPSSVAVQLLKKVPSADLRRIAKSPSMPKLVSQAAKKMVIGV